MFYHSVVISRQPFFPNHPENPKICVYASFQPEDRVIFPM